MSSSHQRNLEHVASWKVFEKADDEVRSPGEPDETWSSRQVEQYFMTEDLIRWHGRYDKSAGPNGAHYFGGADNPFGVQGIKCGNCAFYEADGDLGTCEAVEGIIDPNGLCKLWIIPEKVLAEPETAGYTWGKPKKKKKF